MTATATLPATLDVSGTLPIPMHRLVAVELRKLVDTRAGRWLLIIQALLTFVAATIVIIVVAVQDESIELHDFTGIGGVIMSVLLPVMGILAITSEWTQRTHMTTFALEPRRARVVTAKVSAILLAGVASILIAFVIGIVCSAIASAAGVDVSWSFDPDHLGGFVVAQTLGVLTGFAFGALLLSTPAAIVVYFASFTVLPGLLLLGDSLSWFESIRPWIDFSDAQVPLAEDGLTDTDWPLLLVSGAIWLGLPLVAGIVRVLRAEAK